jgi:alpha-mannosidase
VAPSAENSKWPAASLLEVEPSSVIVASLKPGADKKCWIAKLYNASGRPENIKLRGSICREGLVYLSNPSEDRLERVRGPLPILPFGIVTLRMEK